MGEIAKNKPWIFRVNDRTPLKQCQAKITSTMKHRKDVMFPNETKILLFGSDGIVRVR